MSMIYFDNAATTYPKPECVYEQMDKVNRSLSFNAGRGSYALAQQSAQIIDNLRKELLRIANASDVAEVVLSPSATIESDNRRPENKKRRLHIYIAVRAQCSGEDTL